MPKRPETELHDLLIVGGGLVGACLAARLAMARPELKILLVEAANEVPSFSGDAFDPRVIALSPGSQALLESVGAWSTIAAQRACAYRRMHVWDAEGTGSISFDSDELHRPALGHIVENSLAVGSLHQRLLELSGQTGLSCLFGRRIEALAQPTEQEPFARVTLDSSEDFSARLLIAADGATSAVRAMAGFRTRDWDYHQSAIVTTVRTERSHAFTAWQRFQTTGPLAFLPLQRGPRPEAEEHFSSIVWSADTAEAERLMQLSEADFRHALGRAFEHRLGAVTGCDQRVCIPLQQQHAISYYRPGIALVGDAAHRVHPLAGQGVNLGLRDSAVLAEELERACHRKVPLNHLSILQRYERRRQGHNLAAMATMDGFKRLFGSEALTVRWLRNTGMAWVNQQLWLKRRLASMAMN